jgi:hypothetical protein
VLFDDSDEVGVPLAGEMLDEDEGEAPKRAEQRALDRITSGEISKKFERSLALFFLWRLLLERRICLGAADHVFLFGAKRSPGFEMENSAWSQLIRRTPVQRLRHRRQ